MGLTHLGLPVRDLDRARVFCETWFGFDAGPAQRYADGTLFLRNAEGFDLALHPVGSAAGGAAMPTFFHSVFGFQARTRYGHSLTAYPRPASTSWTAATSPT